jgi:hypothetical protein
MRTRVESICGVGLALCLLAGCATDLWYKKGAGTDALAQDKTACRAEVAQLKGSAASEAFEQCMSARDWFHVAASGRRSAARSVARKAASPQPTVALAPASREPARAPAAPVDPTSVRAGVALPLAAPEAPALPSVDAAPEAAEVEAEAEVDADVEQEDVEEALAPEPIDPSSRQFWVKFGAGPERLLADQKTCRRELGVPDSETQPSRWGQSEDFDACMRGRGWSGGSIQNTPNR